MWDDSVIYELFDVDRVNREKKTQAVRLYI